MQHHKQGRTLGRVRKQRTALLRGLARELVLRGGITTTVAKAKELRPYVERLVTAAKNDTVSSRRHATSVLGNAKDAVTVLYKDIAPRYSERPGGYTRIIKLGRTGARAADSARIEFV